MVDSVEVATRVSALAGHYNPGKFGAKGVDGVSGVTLEDRHGLALHQIAAWPDTINEAGAKAASAVDVKSAPGPCTAATGKKGSLLRIEPLKWLVFGAGAPSMAAEQGVTLDLSHSRTHIRITGDQAVTLLNRHLSLDLREKSFPVGSVASTVYHHCGVTLWRSKDGYELFLPRGFALSLWEMLVESAEQFGVEII